MNMLELLDRFERLQLGCLRQNIQAKYEAALQQFMAEIEQLRQVLSYSAVLTVLYAFKPPTYMCTYVRVYEVRWTWSTQCKYVHTASHTCCMYVCTVCTSTVQYLVHNTRTIGTT